MKTHQIYGWRREANKLKGTLRPVFFGLILIVILHLPGYAQETADAKQSLHTEAITSFIDYATKQMKTDRIPGLSIGFMKDDYFWTQGLGYSDLENQVLAKPQNSYRMASISKTFTAVAVLQLVEAGKIDLDEESKFMFRISPGKNGRSPSVCCWDTWVESAITAAMKSNTSRSTRTPKKRSRFFRTPT